MEDDSKEPDNYHCGKEHRGELRCIGDPALWFGRISGIMTHGNTDRDDHKEDCNQKYRIFPYVSHVTNILGH